MKRRAIAGSLLVVASVCTPRVLPAQTAVNASVRIGDFHVAVANYYHVPEREVVVIRERRISDDELPVVLFIARQARVPTARVIELRERGRSWWDISVGFGLKPDVFYVPVAVAPGPPYGKAYGHYKKPRGQWNTIVLSDADVVNMVQLRFLSEHYGVPPERVIEARSHNRDVVTTYSEIGGKKSKEGKQSGHASSSQGQVSSEKGQGNSGKGNGNGNGRGKGH